MSWTEVDLSCVRYSSIEGTHWFYDPAYPASIQFLLSGCWKPWDVGWVKYKAQDPEIRRTAEEAETRLAQDPDVSYTPWPTAPPPGPINAYLYPQVDDARYRGDNTHTSASPSPSPQQYELAVDPALQSPPGEAHTASTDPNIPYPSPQSQEKEQNLDSRDSTERQVSIVPVAPVQPVQPDSDDHAIIKRQGLHLPFAASVGAPSLRKRENKILLSIDGDGIRGLSSLLVIESLVNAICVKVGQCLEAHQIFDLVGGSSLGGVIAVLLCRLRMPAWRAKKAYKRIATQVFSNKRDFFLSLHPKTSTPNADGLALESEIKSVIEQETDSVDEVFFDGSKDSGNVFVVASHTEGGATKPVLIRSYTTRRLSTRRISGANFDTNMSLAHAMKAGCAAPRYTSRPTRTRSITAQPRSRTLEPGLADHGTAKSNPVEDILSESRELFRRKYETPIIISVGTGTSTSPTVAITVDKLPNPDTELYTATAARSATAQVHCEKFEAEIAPLIQKHRIRYFRFNVEGLQEGALEEGRHEEEIKQATNAYLAGEDTAARFRACVDTIAETWLG